MTRAILLNKPRRGLYGKLLERLEELEKEVRGLPVNGYIPYSNVREKICRNFSIKKDELLNLLFFLRDLGFLEISKFGIKLNFQEGKKWKNQVKKK